MRITILFSVLLLAVTATAADGVSHRYVIEREIPGASELSADELREISRKSRDVLASLGPEIKWMHSYVAGDKFYCVYEAPNPDLIRKHAELGGFPADRIEEVSAVIDPSTAE